tara:strand:- start:5278 stop:5649 length:372 start_codon:yes stop_codon:yes gene_type:complete
MSEIGNLTLYREESTAHHFAELGEENIDEPVLEICSNRIKVPLKIGGDTFFFGYCADVMEALTMGVFMEHVQRMIDDNTIGETGNTPTQIAATRNRRRDLLQQVAGFEKAHMVTDRPERPSFN